MIVPVDINVDDLLHAPFVGQWLGPERVYAVLRRGGGALLRAHDGEHDGGKDTNSHRKEALRHGAVIHELSTPYDGLQKTVEIWPVSARFWLANPLPRG